MKAILAITFVMIFPLLLANPVFGHGFGAETVPVTIGNRNATLTLSVTPPTIDSKNNEHEMVVNLSDANSGSVIEHVTYLIELTKNDKRIFRYMFHDEIGNLYMKIKTTNSSTIQIHGKQGAVLGGWMKQDDFNPLALEGKIFADGGLYKFHIEIVTVDSDTK
ncbi:MAG: peptidase, partial [Thaumarchaeota archaeon]|nr:peptidase [Nitrososphaerota archaeon]